MSKAEQKLWELISQSDKNAYAQIHEIYYPRVSKFSQSLIKSRELATQIWIESFAEIWLVREDFSGIELEAFLMSIVRKREIKETREMLNEWSAKQDKDGIVFEAWAATRKLSDKASKKWWVKWNIPFLYDRWKGFYDAG